LHKLSEAGIRVNYFKSNSLVFWTDNKIEINEAQLAMPDGTGVVHLKDGWYQYTKKSNRNTDELFWGLLLIKHDYPFENRFLKNGFNELCLLFHRTCNSVS
jgi:hypothetical protein